MRNWLTNCLLLKNNSNLIYTVMKKVNWVLNSPEVPIRPPKKGTGYKMPDDDSEPETKPPSK